MILYSSSFIPKGFGIKKHLKVLSNDMAVVSNKKISKRKLQKLIKYILSQNERLLNKSHLDITSYGCYEESEILTQLCEMLLLKHDNVSINDPEGYAIQPLKKYIGKFSSVKIYGNALYKELQKQVYRLNGVCIILSDDRIIDAIDTDNISQYLRTAYVENDGVIVTYLDMFRYHGITWEGAADFINVISRCKNP